MSHEQPGVVLGRRAVLKASLLAGGGLALEALIPLPISALHASGLRRTSIAWGELDRMTLAYYSTRRDRRDGWMQLELRSGWTKVRLDSRIDGFAELVDKSARAARSRGLTLNGATLANLAALGVSLQAEPSVREAAGDPI